MGGKTRRKHAMLGMTSEPSRLPRSEILDRVLSVTTIFEIQKTSDGDNELNVWIL